VTTGSSDKEIYSNLKTKVSSALCILACFTVTLGFAPMSDNIGKIGCGSYLSVVLIESMVRIISRFSNLNNCIQVSWISTLFVLSIAQPFIMTLSARDLTDSVFTSWLYSSLLVCALSVLVQDFLFVPLLSLVFTKLRSLFQIESTSKEL
jgi:hypothetical protein